MRRVSAWVLAGALACSAGGARAAVSCALDASELDLGGIPAAVGARATAAAPITVRCSLLGLGLPVAVPVRVWAAPDRYLQGPAGARLPVQFYSDAARSRPFPSSLLDAVTLTVVATLGGGSGQVGLYGDLVIQAPVAPGTYTLSLPLTVEF